LNRELFLPEKSILNPMRAWHMFVCIRYQTFFILTKWYQYHLFSTVHLIISNIKSTHKMFFFLQNKEKCYCLCCFLVLEHKNLNLKKITGISRTICRNSLTCDIWMKSWGSRGSS
jgi:hypothetical protein